MARSGGNSAAVNQGTSCAAPIASHGCGIAKRLARALISSTRGLARHLQGLARARPDGKCHAYRSLVGVAMSFPGRAGSPCRAQAVLVAGRTRNCRPVARPMGCGPGDEGEVMGTRCLAPGVGARCLGPPCLRAPCLRAPCSRAPCSRAPCSRAPEF